MLNKISIHFALTFGPDAPHYFFATKLNATGLSLVSPFSFEYLPQLYKHLRSLETSSLHLSQESLDPSSSHSDSSNKVIGNYQGVVGRSDGSPIPVFETTCTEHNQTMVRSEDYSCPLIAIGPSQRTWSLCSTYSQNNQIIKG